MMLRRVVFASTLLVAGQLFADIGAVRTPSIVILDFELHDLTLNPGTEEERERTQSIGPMLRQALETKHGFEIRTVDSDAQRAADQAVGYLYDHHDVTAELGRDAGSDWIAIGRVHKASFLFVYLKMKLLDTRTHQLIADLTVEVKGSQRRLTKKGVETLAEQIAAEIRVAPN